MKLTNRSEYALLALAMLARQYGNGLVSANEISETQSVPKGFLQQILFALKRGGYVHSIKGQTGGYELARAPSKITVAEIIRFFEGPLAATTTVSKNFYHPSPIESEAGMVALFRRVRDEVAEILESATLAEVSGVSAKVRKGRR